MSICSDDSVSNFSRRMEMSLHDPGNCNHTRQSGQVGGLATELGVDCSEKESPSSCGVPESARRKKVSNSWRVFRGYRIVTSRRSFSKEVSKNWFSCRGRDRFSHRRIATLHVDEDRDSKFQRWLCHIMTKRYQDYEAVCQVDVETNVDIRVSVTSIFNTTTSPKMKTAMTT